MPPADFAVELEPSATVLEALEEIGRAHDPSLVFRHSCHHGSCGTCAVRINGREALACRTTLESLASHEITVEPLRGFPVVADLLVDSSSLFAELPRDISHLRPAESADDRVSPPEVKRFTRFENCIECGACISACPVTESFLGPAALARIAAEIRKSPSRRDELLSPAAGPRGVDRCVQAYECSRVCPSKVYPSRRIIELRGLLGR